MWNTQIYSASERKKKKEGFFGTSRMEKSILIKSLGWGFQLKYFIYVIKKTDYTKYILSDKMEKRLRSGHMKYEQNRFPCDK